MPCYTFTPSRYRTLIGVVVWATTSRGRHGNRVTLEGGCHEAACHNGGQHPFYVVAQHRHLEKRMLLASTHGLTRQTNSELQSLTLRTCGGGLGSLVGCPAHSLAERSPTLSTSSLSSIALVVYPTASPRLTGTPTLGAGGA